MDDRPTTLLLDSIRRAHELNLSTGDSRATFHALLDSLVSLTGSEYGFLDEVRWDEDGHPFKRNLAATEVVWAGERPPPGPAGWLEFRHLENLAGLPALTGEVVISNHPFGDPRSGGLPPGHPPLHSFMGMPLTFGGNLVGVAGIANRSGGYDTGLARWLGPFLSTCASVLHAMRRQEEVQEHLEALERANRMASAILNASPESVILLDTEGCVLAANEVLGQRLGAPTSRIVGRRIYDFLPPEVARSRSAQLAEVVRTGKGLEFEDARGNLLFHHVLRPIVDSTGRVENVAIFGADITERESSRRKLEDAERRVRDLIETAREGIWFMDRDHRTTWVNRQMLGILGFEEAEVVGRPVTDFMPPDQLPDHARKMAIRSVGGSSLYERDFLRKEGGRVTCLVSATPLTDDKGHFDGSVAFFTDISEWGKAKDALRESEARLQRTFDNAPVGVVMVGPDRRFLRCNRFFCDFLGYTEEELLHRSIVDVTHPEDKALGMEDLGRMLAGDLETARVRKRYLRRDHSTVWGDVTIGLIRDSEGRPLYFLPIIQDVTEIMVAEESLRESEAKLAEAHRLLSGVLDHTHVAAAYLDISFNFVWVNSAYARAGRQDPSFFPGRNHFELYPHRENEEVFRRVVDTGEPVLMSARPFEYPDQPDRGVTFWDWSLVPVKDASGDLSGLVLSLAEVTDRVQAVEELRRSEERYRRLAEENAALLDQARRDADAKAVLLHEVNHRVKNNLAAVAGLLRAQDRGVPEDLREGYRRTMADLTQRIQALATAHELLSAAQWEPLPLGEIFGEIMQSGLKLVPGGKRLTHSLHGDPVQVPARLANAVALLLFELATNTVKHAMGDRPAIHVRLEARRTESGLVIRFADDGPGFAEEALMGEKTSLGLYLVRLLASHDLRGEVKLMNDGGAVVELRLGPGSGLVLDPSAPEASLA